MICNCPRCAGAIQNRLDLAGQVIACPYCRQPFQLPRMVVPTPIPAPLHPPTLPVPQPSATRRANTREPSRQKSRDATPTILLAGSVVLLLIVGAVGLVVMNQSSSQPPAAKRKPKQLATPLAGKMPAAETKSDPGKSTKPIRTRTAPAVKPKSTTASAKPEANYETASDSIPFDSLVPNMPSSREVFSQATLPTLAKFESVRTGMSRAEVFAILGAAEPFGKSQQYNSETYLWGTPSRGQVTVIFKNGVVESKSQLGLR